MPSAGPFQLDAFCNPVIISKPNLQGFWLGEKKKWSKWSQMCSPERLLPGASVRGQHSSAAVAQEASFTRQHLRAVAIIQLYCRLLFFCNAHIFLTFYEPKSFEQRQEGTMPAGRGLQGEGLLLGEQEEAADAMEG